MINALQKLGLEITKTYRVYEKALSADRHIDRSMKGKKP
jgi:hypothetical protein